MENVSIITTMLTTIHHEPYLHGKEHVGQIVQFNNVAPDFCWKGWLAGQGQARAIFTSKESGGDVRVTSCFAEAFPKKEPNAGKLPKEKGPCGRRSRSPRRRQQDVMITGFSRSSDSARQYYKDDDWDQLRADVAQFNGMAAAVKEEAANFSNDNGGAGC